MPPPVDPVVPWATGLHEEVRRTAVGAGPRRHLPVRGWVGRPGGRLDHEVLLLPDLPRGLAVPTAAGLRADLVERALDGLVGRSPAPGGADGLLCWVTRSGDLHAGDDELAWWSAARRGFDRHGVELVAFCVLNRFGWVDLRSGAGRTWARVRPRST